MARIGEVNLKLRRDVQIRVPDALLRLKPECRKGLRLGTALPDPIQGFLFDRQILPGFVRLVDGITNDHFLVLRPLLSIDDEKLFVLAARCIGNMFAVVAEDGASGLVILGVGNTVDDNGRGLGKTDAIGQIFSIRAKRHGASADAVEERVIRMGPGPIRVTEPFRLVPG